MKAEKVVHNQLNNQLMIIEKGGLLANINYAKVANKTLEIVAKTIMLSLALTVINMVI